MSAQSISSSAIPVSGATQHEQESAKPAYSYLLTWLLFYPLLTMVAKGSLSFLSPPTSAFSYQNAALAKTAQSVRIPVVLLVLFLVGFIVIGHRGILRTLARNRLIVCGLVFAALSALWSEAPAMTIRTTIDLTLSTCFACYLISYLSPERLMKLLMFIGVIAALLSAAIAVALPQYGVFQGYGGGAWQGICTHKNTLGLAMAFLLTPVFFVQERRSRKIAYAALILFLIAMSQSRGAWFETAGVLSFVAWVAAFRRFQARESLLLVLGTVAVFAGVVMFGLTHMSPLMSLIGKDPTMTGRTDIYAAVMDSIQKQPFWGYGFGAFWQFNQEARNIALSIRWINIGYAENGILELWVQLGAIGVGLVFLMLGRALKQGFKLIRSQYYTPRVGWFTTIIVLEILTNVESGWLMVGDTLDWTLTLVACIGLANEIRQIRQSASSVPLAFRQEGRLTGVTANTGVY
jgi:exopolysaccharide production protein ExoQ